MLQQFAVEHEAMYIPSLASSGGRVGQQENFLACSFDGSRCLAAVGRHLVEHLEVLVCQQQEAIVCFLRVGGHCFQES